MPDDSDWQFVIDQLREKTKYQHDTAIRLLVNALEAANADPPFLPAVKERIETVIELLKS